MKSELNLSLSLSSLVMPYTGLVFDMSRGVSSKNKEVEDTLLSLWLYSDLKPRCLTGLSSGESGRVKLHEAGGDGRELQPDELFSPL